MRKGSADDEEGTKHWSQCSKGKGNGHQDD